MTELILGNLNYSSWSIRAALVARGSGLDIPERVVPLGFEETRETLLRETAHHTVPVLVHDDLIIRDSLAITEWIAERAPARAVWPEDASERALARSIVAQMHAGFFALRGQMAVDIRSQHPTPDIVDGLRSDIDRVLALWEMCLSRPGSAGPFLFGSWSAADAFYAPVVTRFRTYGYELTGAAKAYSQAVWESSLITKLRAEAEAEPWCIEATASGPIRAWIRN